MLKIKSLWLSLTRSKQSIKEKELNPSILEKIKRNSDLDQIEIGQIIERVTSGEFGTVLRCIINAIIDEQIEISKDYRISSDRSLGRIESLKLLQDRLDTCIEIKNQLTEEQQTNNAL